MNILIADDEPLIVEPLIKVFESQGHQVRFFQDGRSAFDQALANKPDLVILDVLMPKLNGWEVCRKLKERENTRAIPVIILTAKSKNVDEIMSAEVGADLYLNKPFNPLEVYEQAIKLKGEKR